MSGIDVISVAKSHLDDSLVEIRALIKANKERHSTQLKELDGLGSSFVSELYEDAFDRLVSCVRSNIAVSVTYIEGDPVYTNTNSMIKTAVVYRTNAKELKSKTESHNYNESSIPQFEACVFSDGRVAQRWLTETGSMVWWDSWEELCKVHVYAHPDYGTKVFWSDGKVDEL